MNDNPLQRIQYALGASLLVLILLLTYYFLPKTTEEYIDDLANKDVGISHRHVFQGLMGGGAVFFDFNNDNYIDLFLTG